MRKLAEELGLIRDEYRLPIICSLHPRTKNRIQRYGVDAQNGQIKFHAPLGFFDFICLERNALCVLSDSGTVQEECCIFRVANVTIRDVTERPETIECGSNMLSGTDPQTVLHCVHTVHDQRYQWTVPTEYLAEHVSNTVVKIVLGYNYYSTRSHFSNRNESE